MRTILSLSAAIACCLGFLATPVDAAPDVRLRVEAGPHARRGTPVRLELPAGTDLDFEHPVVKSGTGRSAPAQWESDERRALVFILPDALAAKEIRVYRLEEAPAAPPAAVALERQENRRLLLKVAGKPMLRYNAGVEQPPEGVPALFARSGYIHPVWSPAGRVVTNDFPRAHMHHHGIWFPWTNTEFEGRHVDFWNSKELEGKVECTGVDASYGGPVYGGVVSRQRFLDLKAPGGPKEVLKERWDVRVYALPSAFLVDFESVQECSSDSPLHLKQYRYGGFGFRGSAQWEGEHVEFLTSEGKTRKDGHATTARWCAEYGLVDGAPCGITFFCHPDNFRAPQNMRIHPSEPFFNWAPCQAGDFSIEPGEPYRSRYRFVVYDGKPAVGDMERLWNDYAAPPRCSLMR